MIICWPLQYEHVHNFLKPPLVLFFNMFVLEIKVIQKFPAIIDWDFHNLLGFPKRIEIKFALAVLKFGTTLINPIKIMNNPMKGMGFWLLFSWSSYQKICLLETNFTSISLLLLQPEQLNKIFELYGGPWWV